MHWKNKGFFTSLVFHIRKSHTIVFTTGDDGSRQYASDAATILGGFSVNSKFTDCFIRSENFALENKRFFTSLFLHIRKSHTIVLTIGDDGSRQYSSVAAKILRGFSVKSKFTYCFIRSENFSLEKQTVLLVYGHFWDSL